MAAQVHLLDRLGTATVQAPVPGCVSIQSITIARQARMSLFQHPPSTVTFTGLPLGRNPVLKGGCGLKDVCWDLVRSPVRFKLTLVDARERTHVLLEETIDVRPGGHGRRWLDWRLDLAAFRNQTVSLVFATECPAGDVSYCWAGWSDPVLECDVLKARRGWLTLRRRDGSVPSRSQNRHDRHHHLLLITSDALRADHLGCYGHPMVKTPHLDRLAREGTLFMHARAQSVTTPGSYATILTGRYPVEHGMHAEWGHVPEGIVNLPRHLSARGYHTLLACSEAELGEVTTGWGGEFDERIHCLGTPMQSGDITARQFLHWLKHRPDRPFFAWLHFFDTHPPLIAAEPFRSMYYQGDPEDELQRYRADGVGEIHGCESVYCIQRALQVLSDGFIDIDLVVRLADTAESLCDARHAGPDLASHLRSLGAEVWRGQSLAELGTWLRGQVAKLRAGYAAAELIAWLNSVLPALLRIEAGILSWLRGVVDFRFPVAQYMGAVSHLDHLIGTVRDGLHEQGLYEQTTIVFTSPHGELLGEHGMTFHHHAPLEEVLRVPLIIKPAVSAAIGRGQRIAGIFDHVDLMPTLLDALSLPHPADETGTSRWSHVQDGSAIPEHDSIASSLHNALYALTRPPYIYFQALAPCLLSHGWRFQPGDEALFKLNTPMDYADNLVRDEPDVAQDMAARLERWLNHKQTAAPRNKRQAA